MNERDEFLRDRLGPGVPDPNPRAAQLPDPSGHPPVVHPAAPPVPPRPAPPRQPSPPPGPPAPPRHPAPPGPPQQHRPAPPREPLHHPSPPPSPPRSPPRSPPDSPPRSPWADSAIGSLRVTDPLLPDQGWRRLVRTLTFGLVNPGPSAAQREEAQFRAAIQAALHGNHKLGVLGKGGVGKTSVAASVGSILAEFRQQDRVVAVDADTAFGRLSSRIDPHVRGSFWELTADKNLQSFSDVIARVGRNPVGLYVLGGEPAAGPRRVLDPAIYREAALRLDRHFAISIIDCGSTMDSPVTQEVLRDLDALIVVSSPWADGASAAAKTMEWLADHGLERLLRNTIVVLNDSDGHADKRTRALLAREFVDHGQPVVEVPFDPHLRPGGVIDVRNEMAAATRHKFLEVTATITGYFASRPAVTRDRSPRPGGR